MMMPHNLPVVLMHFLWILQPVLAQMRLLGGLTFLLWVWTSMPAVRAFPAYLPPTGHTVSSSFRFPTIPFQDGLRHIHTLEHLESIASQYFRIHRVGQPVRYGDFVTVTADCLIQGGHHTICVLARPEQNHTCTYMCLQGAAQRAQIQLRVRPSKREGHILTMDTTYYTGKRVLDRDLRPTMNFLNFFEEKTKRQGLPFTPHPNLLWYRRMVLGLPYVDREGGPL